MKSTKSKTSRGSDSSNVTASTLTNSSSLPSVVHVNEAAFNAMVSKIVNDTVFPKKQFIVLEKELDSQGKLASKCLAALHMERSQWHTVKELVRKRLNRKRNNTQLSIRRNLFRKYRETLVLVTVLNDHVVSIDLMPLDWMCRLLISKWTRISRSELQT